MADSLFDGCYDPKKPSPDQLYPLLYKISAAAEIALCQLHFYGTKNAADYVGAALGEKKFDDEKYYIVSKMSKIELLETDFYELVVLAFGEEMAEDIVNSSEYFEPEKSYTLIALDINKANLGDNVCKNPTVIIDTHADPMSEAIGLFALCSILKCDQQEFEAFIQEIGYENENHYLNDIETVYANRVMEKTFLLIVNSFFALMFLLLFNITFFRILNEQFKNNAVEIIVKKINGMKFCKRYMKTLAGFLSTWIIGSITAFTLCYLLFDIEARIVVMSNIVILINVVVGLLITTQSIERKNIAIVLKGGYTN